MGTGASLVQGPPPPPSRDALDEGVYSTRCNLPAVISNRASNQILGLLSLEQPSTSLECVFCDPARRSVQFAPETVALLGRLPEVMDLARLTSRFLHLSLLGSDFCLLPRARGSSASQST